MQRRIMQSRCSTFELAILLPDVGAGISRWHEVPATR